LYDKSLTIEQNLILLEGTPTWIANMTVGLAPAQLRWSPGPGEWSARDVLAHLRACSDMWGRYIVKILDEDHPTYKAISPRTWIKKTDFLEQEFLPSLEAFTIQRARLLAVLKPLPPEAWSRTALVKGAGKPRERSVRTYAQWLANHERSHFNQFERIVNDLMAA
jgi:hypothetical protein